METILFSLSIAGLFTLVFLGISACAGWLINGYQSFDTAKIKSIAEKYRLALCRKETQKKILIFAVVLLFWMVGISLSSIWGMALISPGKSLKILFAISMPFFYLFFIPICFLSLKKHIGAKVAALTIIFFILSVICVFIAVKYVDVFGLH